MSVNPVIETDGIQDDIPIDVVIAGVESNEPMDTESELK